MTWQARLKPTIELTSPSGKKFDPKFVGSPRHMEKKVGIFAYPKVRGNIVQDLDTNSVIYPLTFFFDGRDNDLKSDEFFRACSERGRWEVIHPVHGFKGLKLLSVEEDIQPVESGNVTQFNSEWIEDIDPSTLQTIAELRGFTGRQGELCNISAADQFVRLTRAANSADKFSLTSAINKATTTINKVLKPIAELNSNIASNQLAITRSIQDLLTASVFQPLTLAAQMQNLVQNPLRATNDIRNRLSTYKKLAQDIFGFSNDGTNNAARNQYAVRELTTTSILTANGLIITSGPSRPSTPTEGDLQSRSQAIEFANSIGNTFLDIINDLDLIQDQFSNENIENQLFSQSDSYSETLRITALATNYLLRSAFNLFIEKRIRLDIPKHPVRVTVEQYGSLGENDQFLDLLISSNNLKDTEIILLSAGKELVIYA